MLTPIPVQQTAPVQTMPHSTPATTPSTAEVTPVLSNASMRDQELNAAFHKLMEEIEDLKREQTARGCDGWAEAQLRVKSYEGMSLDELAAEMKRELAELAASTSYRRAVSGTE